MGTGAGPSGSETAVIVLVIVVLLIARRAVGMARGTVVSPGRLFGFAGFYTLLFVLVVAFGTVEPPWTLYVGLPALLVVSAVVSTRYVERHVVLEQRPPDTRWYYKLHPWILVAYLGLFVARLGVSFAVLGPSALSFGAPSTGLSPGASALLIVVDLLFAVSTGLLLGRSVGVYLAYRAKIAEGPANPPIAPPAAPPLGSDR